MTPYLLVFIVTAIVTLGAALMVVTARSLFHAALWLILALLGVGVMFVLLNAGFFAVVQVLIYIGAIAILMIFAIMLSENLASRKIQATNKNAAMAFFVSVSFVIASGILVWLTITDNELKKYFFVNKGELPADNIATLGKYLMTEYMLPFEVVSVLLLAAMIGAIVLARKEHS